MVPSHRVQNVLIALLAVVAIAVSALAVVKVNRPQASGAALGATGSPTPATPATPADDAAATSEAPDDEEASTDGPEGSAGIDAWVQAWSDDADLLVVGDGFSNLPTQWLQLWATSVGVERPVTIRHWGEAADVSFNDPIVLTEGDGPLLTVWSASRDGSSIHGAA